MSLTPTRPRPREESPAPSPGRRGWFRAFWRWHFYAAFLVVPVLLMLSVTGLIYLFRFQIEPSLHADLMRVEQPTGTDFAQPYAAQHKAVEAAYPDATVMSMTEPSQDGSTRFSAVMPDGSSRDVFVDPWTTEVLGALDPDRTVSGVAVRLHGELMAGPAGDYLIELAACWAVVMAVTGYYLFARGRAARRRRRRTGVPAARLRSRHALVGSVVGGALLLLVVSGLPWTGFWGEQVQTLATRQGSSMWSQDPGAVSDPTSRLDESLPHAHGHEVPWALGGSEVPPGAAEHGAVASIDTAVEVADREGLRHPMTVALPGDDRGVFSVIGYAFDAPSDERTVHVDRFGGDLVSTYGYADYPVLAKTVSQGIGLHEGRSLGPVGFWLSAAMCLGVAFLCLTGPAMWWRRRPRGSTSVTAPRGRMPLRTTPVLAVGVVALGLLLPLFGLSLLMVLVLDQVVLRRVPRLRHLFDVTG